MRLEQGAHRICFGQAQFHQKSNLGGYLDGRVPPEQCVAANGVIRHPPSGRTVSYGAIAPAAAAIEPPAEIELKPTSEWKLAGTPQKRLDVLDKITAKPVYAIDVRLPGMLYAAIVQCPIFGGALQSVDETSIAA